jgi:hypothetical protein
MSATSLDKEKGVDAGFGTLKPIMTEAYEDALRQHGHNERRDGRWVLDPEEARQEFGDEVRMCDCLVFIFPVLTMPF